MKKLEEMFKSWVLNALGVICGTLCLFILNSIVDRMDKFDSRLTRIEDQLGITIETKTRVENLEKDVQQLKNNVYMFRKPGVASAIPVSSRFYFRELWRDERDDEFTPISDYNPLTSLFL